MADVKYVYTGTKFMTRDDKNVLHIATYGDEVLLNDEQQQRLSAGKEGSVFVSVAAWNKAKREESEKAENPFGDGK